MALHVFINGNKYFVKDINSIENSSFDTCLPIHTDLTSIYVYMAILFHLKELFENLKTY